jgi:hypothetical protein
MARPLRDLSAGTRGLERRWWTLIAVCGSTFMLLVDIFIVQVALPTIHRRVGGSFTDLQWVIDAYALALAAFILTFVVLLGAIAGLALVRARDLEHAPSSAPRHPDTALKPSAP